MSKGSSQEELGRRAAFIFTGTVQKPKASTIPGMPVTDQTIVVRVDQITRAPKVLAQYMGKDLTVQLSRGQNVKRGQQAIFYTNGWLFGESAAVRSIRFTDVGQATAALASAQRLRTTEDRDLQAHLARADMVVTGTVLRVRSSPEPTLRSGSNPRGTTGTGSRVSEHAARWREAVIDVQHTEKGGQSSRRVVVRFPGSTDVAWARAPKFKPGQKGVFILHKAAPDDGTRARTRRAAAGATAAVQAYTALHAQDFQPIERAAQIRTLVGAATPRKPAASRKKRAET